MKDNCISKKTEFDKEKKMIPVHKLRPSILNYLSKNTKAAPNSTAQVAEESGSDPKMSAR